MKTYSDGYSYEEALIDEMDELGFDPVRGKPRRSGRGRIARTA